MGADAVRVIEHLKNEIPTFTNEYFNEFMGKARFKEFNPKRTKGIEVQGKHVIEAFEQFGELVEVKE